MSDTSKPAYREPGFWLVMAPLILVVIACSITMTIALKSADDVVTGNYYKEGRLLSEDTRADHYASEQGIEGALNLDRVAGTVSLTVNQTTFDQDNIPEAIELLISHPAKAELDRTLSLPRASANRFAGDVEALPAGRWYLRADAVVAGSVRWRLHGEVVLDERALVRLR